MFGMRFSFCFLSVTYAGYWFDFGLSFDTQYVSCLVSQVSFDSQYVLCLVSEYRLILSILYVSFRSIVSYSVCFMFGF